MSEAISAVQSNSVLSESDVSRLHPDTVSSRDLTKDDFLYLLTAQLANQNPLEPMKNETFIAELASFSHLSNSTEQTKILTGLGDSINALRNDFRKVHNLPVEDSTAVDEENVEKPKSDASHKGVA